MKGVKKKTTKKFKRRNKGGKATKLAQECKHYKNTFVKFRKIPDRFGFYSRGQSNRSKGKNVIREIRLWITIPHAHPLRNL